MSGAGGHIIGDREKISEYACINDRDDDLVSRHGIEWAESRCCLYA